MEDKNLIRTTFKTNDDVEEAVKDILDSQTQCKVRNFYRALLEPTPEDILTQAITQYVKILALPSCLDSHAECVRLLKAAMFNAKTSPKVEVFMNADRTITIDDIIDNGTVTTHTTAEILIATSRLEPSEAFEQAMWLGKSGVLNCAYYDEGDIELEFKMPDNYKEVIANTIEQANDMYKTAEAMKEEYNNLIKKDTDIHVEYGLYDPNIKVGQPKYGGYSNETPNKKKGDK